MIEEPAEPNWFDIDICAGSYRDAIGREERGWVPCPCESVKEGSEICNEVDMMWGGEGAIVS